MVSGHRKVDLAETALREHRELQKLLGSVQRHVAVGSTERGEVARALLEDLKTLRENLVRHFRREEEGKLFEDIVARLPMEDRVVENLKREHPEFLRTLAVLIHRLEQRKSLMALRKNLDFFVSAFLSHEQTENELLQRAYYRELGAPD